MSFWWGLYIAVGLIYALFIVEEVKTLDDYSKFEKGIVTVVGILLWPLFLVAAVLK